VRKVRTRTRLYSGPADWLLVVEVCCPVAAGQSWAPDAVTVLPAQPQGVPVFETGLQLRRLRGQAVSQELGRTVVGAAAEAVVGQHVAGRRQQPRSQGQVAVCLQLPYEMAVPELWPGQWPGQRLELDPGREPLEATARTGGAEAEEAVALPEERALAVWAGEGAQAG